MNRESLEKYAKEIEGWTMIQLLEGRAGWAPDTAAWQVVDREIRRRDERGTRLMARAAFAVSCLSLVVAALTFYLKVSGHPAATEAAASSPAR